MNPLIGDVAAPKNSLGRTALFFAVGFLIVFGLYAIAKANKPEQIPAPTAYLPFTAADKSFICEAPAGWKQEDYGVEGSENGGALFQNSSAKISIATSQSASAMADMMNATNAQQQQAREDLQNMPGGPPAGMAVPPPPVPAVEQIHKSNRAEMESNYADYSEQPLHAFQCHLGDARLSEWTGVGASGNKMHGYRVTMLTQDKALTLICRCHETDWKTLEPAFVRVIHSVDRGPG